MYNWSSKSVKLQWKFYSARVFPCPCAEYMYNILISLNNFSLKSLGHFLPNFMSILLLKWDWELAQIVMLHWLSCPIMVKNNNKKTTHSSSNPWTAQNGDPFISCIDRIGKMLHNICISAVAISLRWVSHGPWAFLFICAFSITKWLLNEWLLLWKKL